MYKQQRRPQAERVNAVAAVHCPSPTATSTAEQQSVCTSCVAVPADAAMQHIHHTANTLQTLQLSVFLCILQSFVMHSRSGAE